MSPALTDGIVRFDPLTDATADAFAEAAQAAAAHVGAWMTPALVPTAPEAVAAFVRQWERERADGTGAGYVISREAAPVGFGFLNTVHPQHRFANLGYWVRPEAAGQGVATVATVLLARDGFERLGLVRIEILMDPDNVASRRVAEKAGATFEGRLRNRLVSRGGVHDALLYSLVPPEPTRF